MSSGGFEGVALLVVEIFVCCSQPGRQLSSKQPTAQDKLTSRVGDELQRATVPLHLGVQSREVEAVDDVLVVHFAKVLVALAGEKPRNPAVGVRGGGGVGEFVHCEKGERRSAAFGV